MSESPVEKTIADVAVPLVEKELDGPVTTWLAANLKSASPQIQAVEADLAPFLIKAVTDILATLT